MQGLGSNADTQYKPKPNTWLVSNTSLYFSERVRTEGKVDFYTIPELSKLSEAILLADKIVTLYGGEHDKSSFFPDLRGEGLLEDINNISQGGIFFNRSTLANSYLDQFLTAGRHREAVAKIITNTFSVSDKMAREAVEDSTKREITQNKFILYEMGESGSNAKGAISENYLRTISYLDLAASHGLNYSPDSFRVPIVDYVNQSLIKTLKPYAINQKPNLIKRILEIIYAPTKKNWTVDIGQSFYFEVPACFGIIIKECKSRSGFIDKALELRKENYLKKFRSKLAELDEANRDEANRLGYQAKADKIVNDCQKIFEEAKKEWRIPYEVLITVAFPFIKLLTGTGHPDLTDELSSVSPIALQGALHYIKKRRLQYLHDLKKRFDQIVNVNEQIGNVFGSKLSDNQINSLNKLHSFQPEFAI